MLCFFSVFHIASARELYSRGDCVDLASKASGWTERARQKESHDAESTEKHEVRAAVKRTQNETDMEVID